MVMKRYPNGAAGHFFFQKRAPVPRPDWVEVCSIEHASYSIIDFPIAGDLPSLLWIVNLGCIDLNQWFARCDDVQRPDYLHFDLDAVEGTEFKRVCETAMLVHRALDALKIPNFASITSPRASISSAICGSRCSNHRADSSLRSFYEPAHKATLPAHGRVARERNPQRRWLAIRAPL